MGSMALEGPAVRYSRPDELLSEPPVARALRLAREVEELLAESPASSNAPNSSRAHSLRMARAMAASLVDELEALAPRSAAARKSGTA